MSITRRGLLAGIIAAAAAPSIVRASSIMRIDTRIIRDPREGWTFEQLPPLTPGVYVREIDKSEILTPSRCLGKGWTITEHVSLIIASPHGPLRSSLLLGS